MMTLNVLLTSSSRPFSGWSCPVALAPPANRLARDIHRMMLFMHITIVDEIVVDGEKSIGLC